MDDLAKSKRFLLVYGSQTGQSKAISEEIAERCDRIGIDADIRCFGRIEKEFVLENENLVVIVVSTTGDGDPPDTVAKFWRRIKRKTLLNTLFSRMRFALLGLGDSNYGNYCKCPTMVNDRLQELGAVHFMPPGFADDATGLEVVVEPWIDSLLENLCAIFDLPPPSQDNKAVNSAINCNGDAQTKSDNTQQVSGLTDQVVSKLTLNSRSEGIGNDIVDVPSGDLGSDSKEIVETSVKPPPIGWTEDISVVDTEQLDLPITPASYIKLDYTEDASLSAEDMPIQNNAKLPFAKSPVHQARINSIKCLTTADSVKKTLCVELDCMGLTDYESGDSFSIVAQNNEEEVTWLLNRLKVAEPSSLVNLSIFAETTKKKASVPEFINNPGTILHIFRTCLDIRHTPKKAFLKLLSSFCTDREEKQRLLYLSSRQGFDLYRQLITGSKRGLLDILHAFASCTPSIESLLENLPRLLPRAYSVASVSGAPSLKCAFNVLELPSLGSLSQRNGLVTGRFDDVLAADQMNSSTVGIYLRTQQHFRLPADPTIPLILIGPGTGVAPFIGFLEDREKLMHDGKTFGESILFFGNRHKERDYLFRKELSHHLAIGTLTQLHVCFSRDEDAIGQNGAKYVTDLLRQQSGVLSRLITNESAIIYVCGDAKNMAKDVFQAITDILKKENCYTDDEVQTVMKGLRDERRYKEDVWI